MAHVVQTRDWSLVPGAIRDSARFIQYDGLSYVYIVSTTKCSYI
jgi:hypothetical protein